MWREITKSLDGLQRRSTNGNLIPPLSSAFLVRAITWVTLKCSILGCLSRLHMLRELEESVRTAFSTSANEDEGPGDTGLLGDWDSRLQITEVRWRRCCCVGGCLIDSCLVESLSRLVRIWSSLTFLFSRGLFVWLIVLLLLSLACPPSSVFVPNQGTDIKFAQDCPEPAAEVRMYYSAPFSVFFFWSSTFCL